MNPQELRYVKTHEWIEPSGSRRKIGLSNFAQEQLGDIVYMDFSAETGRKVDAGDEIGVIESCKAASSIYSPLAGTIVAVNTALADRPELINQSPYEDGWLCEIEVTGDVDAAALMSHDDYSKSCEEE